MIWVAAKLLILATALLGQGGAIYLLAEYITDRIALDGQDGDAQIAAAIGIRSAAAITLVLLLFMIFAIVGLMTPPPPPDRTVAAAINYSIFEAVTLALTVLKYLNLRDRLRLRIRWATDKRPKTP